MLPSILSLPCPRKDRCWRLTLVSLVLSVLLPTAVAGQEYNYRLQHWGNTDGLLHRNVHYIAEDREGFLWIGTDKGVQRFDGHEFKSWTKASTAGKVATTGRLTQDPDGWIWVENTSFIHSITGRTKTAEERFGPDFPVVVRQDETGWIPAYLNIFPRDTAGRMLFLLNRPTKLVIYEGDGTFTTRAFPGLPNAFLDLHFVDRRNQLWVTVGRENSVLYRVSMQGEVLERYCLPDHHDVDGFREAGDTVFFELNSPVAVQPSTSGFYAIPPGEPAQLLTTFRPRREFWQWLDDGRFLTLTPERLTVYDRPNGKELYALDLSEHPADWFTDRIHCKVDSRGSIWLGNWAGLTRIDVRPNRFRRYLSFNTDDRPINPATRQMVVRNDSLFVCGETAGLLVVPLDRPAQWRVLIPLMEDVHQEFRGLYERAGTLLVGRQALIMETTHAGDITGTHHCDVPQAAIWTIYDHEGTVWAGSSDGLHRLSENQHPYALRTPLAPPGSIAMPDKYVFHVEEAEAGNLWLCGRQGLYLFDPRREVCLARYGELETGANYLPAARFNWLHRDRAGIYWLGTDDGLIRWDKDTGEYRIFTTVDGLSNDVIYAILEDNRDQLWLSSDYGLMQFDKSTRKVRTFLEPDGISHHEFNRTSATRDSAGNFYFGGLNGITAFHPDSLYLDDVADPPSLLVTGFELFSGAEGKVVDRTAHLLEHQQFTYRPGDRFFRLRFSLMSFEDPAQVNYAYRIEGVDQDWNYQSANTLQLSKLPYGHLVLRIRGQDATGVWSPHEVTIGIHVIKPLYLRTWFLLTCGLLIAGITVAFFRERTRTLQREINRATATIAEQAEELRQLDQLKSRFFANFSHELRTPLTLMLGPIRRLRRAGPAASGENSTLLDFLERNTLHLRGLVSELLDVSRLENGTVAVNAEPTPVRAFVQSLLARFAPTGSSHDVLVEQDLRLDADTWLLLDRGKCSKILSNYLSNAIKFTPAGGTVIVLAEVTGDTLQLEVRDNGPGIPPEDLAHVFDRFYQSRSGSGVGEGGSGIGLSLCRELATLLGGTVAARSTPGRGSRFFLTLPAVVAEPGKLGVIAVPPPADPISAGLPRGKRRTSTTLLVVEDNPDLQQYFRIILADFEVVVADHGRAALDLLAEGLRPDLILSDLMMPVMDGLELLEHLKASDDFRHLPVIILTAKTAREVKLEALRFGIDDYLTKPFDDEELLVRIDNLLRHRRERQTAVDPSRTDVAERLAAADLAWLRKVETYVLQHLEDDDLQVDGVARAFAMSASTLSRQLKRITGLSPGKYLRELRLNQAREYLLSNPELTVAQIAYRVGFQDPAAFSRSFRNRFGRSPTEMAA